MKRRYLFATLLLFLSACVTAGDPTVGQVGREPTDEELVKDFLKVTFEDDNGFDWTYLRKFEGPVRVKVHGQPTVEDTSRIDWVIAEAARRGGVDIRRATEREDGNFHVYLSNTLGADALADWMARNEASVRDDSLREEWFKAFAKGIAARMVAASGGGREVCYVHLWQHDHRPDIESAHAVIYAEQNVARRQRCIVEEMLQALGLVADTRKAWASIFSSDQRLPNPSEYDWQYLRMLYDRRIHSGMVRDQARIQALVVRREIAAGRLTPPEQIARFDPTMFVPANELILRTFMDVAYRRFGRNPIQKLYKPMMDVTVLISGSSQMTPHAKKNIDNIFSYVEETVGQRIRTTQNKDTNYQAAISFNESKKVDDTVHSMYSGSFVGIRQSGVRVWRRYLENNNSFVIYYHYYTYDDELRHYAAAVFEDYPVRPKNGYCLPLFAMQLNALNPTARIPWKTSLIPWHNCPNEMSPYDVLFIRLMNDPRMLSGMKEKEAEQVLRQILAELRPDQTQSPDVSRFHMNHIYGAPYAPKQ